MSRATLQHWRAPALIAGALLIAIFALYWQTAWSMVSIWLRSETYTHGFLIFPISTYMIWHNRAAAADLSPAPNYWMLLALAALGFGWMLSDMAGVLVSAQCIALLTQPNPALGQAARNRVVTGYSWARHLANIDRALNTENSISSINTETEMRGAA